MIPDILKDLVGESKMERIMPILDMYQLTKIKQIQLAANKKPSIKELDDELIRLESEIIFIFEEGKNNDN